MLLPKSFESTTKIAIYKQQYIIEMDADLKKIKKFTKMMKKEGVLVLKTPELEIHLSPDAVVQEEAPVLQESSPANTKEEPALYSEMDTLFWSTPNHLIEEAHS